MFGINKITYNKLIAYHIDLRLTESKTAATKLTIATDVIPTCSIVPII